MPRCINHLGITHLYHFEAKACHALLTAMLNHSDIDYSTMNQTITAELIKHRDKHIAEKYGVQLNAVYVDHADTERPAFEKMLADAKTGSFDIIIRTAFIPRST